MPNDEGNIEVRFKGTKQKALYEFSLLLIIMILGNQTLANKLSTLNNGEIVATILSIFQLFVTFLSAFVWFRFVFNNISLSNEKDFSLPKKDIVNYWGFILYTAFLTSVAGFIFGFLKSFFSGMEINVWLNILISFFFYMVCLNYIAYIVTKRLVKEIYLGEENLYFSISYFEYLLNSIKSIFFAITLIGLPKSFEIIFNDNFIKAIKSENYKFIFKAKYWGIFSNCLSYFLVGITVIGYPFALLGLLKWFISRTEVKTINQ